MTVLFFLLVLSLAVLGYAWVLYPVLVRLLPGRPVSPGSMAASSSGRVVVLVAAHNEEETIARRIRNLLDENETRLEAVLVGVDGATDRTADRVREKAAEDRRVVCCKFSQRRGKVAVLRDLVGVAESQYKADILIFTDANTRFQRDALKRLLIPMQDATVGGVCGRLVLDDSSEQPLTHEPLYWRWEARLKQMESRLDSCLGANGAIYALRCGLFWKDVPPNTIVDDFVLGMKVREAGYRMIFAPDAVAEEALPDVADEWRRRVRIGAGDFQALGLCRACLSPRYGRFAWMFWSHKVLRWLTPPMGLLAVAAAALLSVWGRSLVPPIADARLFLADSVVLVVLAALLAAGLGALLRRFSRDRRRWARPFVAWHYFMLMQLALLVGFVRFCRGNLQGSWDRTARRSRERMHDSGR